MQPLPYFRPDSTLREAAGLEHARQYLKYMGLGIQGFLPHDGTHNMAPVVARKGRTLYFVIVRVFPPGKTAPLMAPELRHARRVLTAVLNEVAAGPNPPYDFTGDLLAIEVDGSLDGRAVRTVYASGLIAGS